jgi:hypothetical protein
MAPIKQTRTRRGARTASDLPRCCPRTYYRLMSHYWLSGRKNINAVDECPLSSSYLLAASNMPPQALLTNASYLYPYLNSYGRPYETSYVPTIVHPPSIVSVTPLSPFRLFKHPPLPKRRRARLTKPKPPSHHRASSLYTARFPRALPDLGHSPHFHPRNRRTLRKLLRRLRMLMPSPGPAFHADTGPPPSPFAPLGMSAGPPPSAPPMGASLSVPPDSFQRAFWGSDSRPPTHEHRRRYSSSAHLEVTHHHSHVRHSHSHGQLPPPAPVRPHVHQAPVVSAPHVPHRTEYSKPAKPVKVTPAPHSRPVDLSDFMYSKCTGSKKALCVSAARLLLCGHG